MRLFIGYTRISLVIVAFHSGKEGHITAKLKILIADDHAVLREGMRNLLEREKDFEVVGEASDGEEAVRLSRELEPDVVIMDIVMPKLSGIEATKLIKQARPATTILILTAYSDIRYIVGLLKIGASGYLLKSARSKEIIRAIQAVRSGESVLDSTVTHKLLQRVVGLTSETSEGKASELLTLREIEILKLAAKGMSNKSIANELFLSVRTVKAHLTTIFHKMDCGCRTDAIIKGLREGYITLDDIPQENESG